MGQGIHPTFFSSHCTSPTLHFFQNSKGKGQLMFIPLVHHFVWCWVNYSHSLGLSSLICEMEVALILWSYWKNEIIYVKQHSVWQQGANQQHRTAGADEGSLWLWVHLISMLLYQNPKQINTILLLKHCIPKEGYFVSILKRNPVFQPNDISKSAHFLFFSVALETSRTYCSQYLLMVVNPSLGVSRALSISIFVKSLEVLAFHLTGPWDCGL